MDSKAKVLIVDDDTNITELISLYLEKENYITMKVDNGIDAIHVFKSFSPDLVILDIMLPGRDGFDVCKDIRQISHTPILMLSAKRETFDKILGLELGADDYMVKPFDTKELTARVKAILRRYTPKQDSSKELTFPSLRINLSNYTVLYNENVIEMPPKEIELLHFLALNSNQVFTREQLLDHIWGYEYIGDTRTVDVHIKRIREKIGESDVWSIKTVWGIGYKFEVI